jgi:hypothetical protein
MRDSFSRAGRGAGAGRVAALSLAGTLLAGNLALSQSKASVPSKSGAPPPNEISLTGALAERATSNPRSETDSSSPEGDYVSDLRADLSARRRSERTDWSLNFQPFYTRYHVNSDLDSANYTFDFDGRYDLSRRVKLTLGQHGSYSRNPLYVAQFETGNAPVITTETKRWMSRSSVSVATEISRSLNVQVGTAFGLARFQDPTFYDNQNYSVSAGLTKTISRSQTLSAGYNYLHFLLTAPQLPESTTTGHGLQGGWAYALTAESGISVSLGASRVTQDAFQQTLYTGDASLRHAFKSLAISGGYRQGLAADLGASEVNLSRDLYAALEGKLGRSAHWGLVGNYGTRTSALDQGVRQDITYMGGALRGDIQLHEQLSLIGEASWRRQDNAGDSGTNGQIPSGEVTVNWLFLGLDFKIF